MARRGRPRHVVVGALALLSALVITAATPAGATEAPPAPSTTDGAGAIGPGDPGAPPPAPDEGASPRIVGGSESPEGQWPSIVSIQRNDGSQHCGGSLVSATWVLTAAHCIVNGRGQALVSPATHRVRAGSNSRLTGGTVHQMVRAIVHPRYDGASTLHNDIALIQLATPTRQPQIPMSYQGDDPILAPPGGQVWAAGWGNTNPDFEGTPSYPVRVRHAAQTVQSESVCRASAAEVYTATSICAWGLDSGSCHGDSGGPLMAYYAPQQRYFLVGVVSYGIPDANGQYCGNRTYATTYTRVSSFSGWVEDMIESGPHRSEDALIRQVHRDFIGREPTAAELSRWQSYLATQKWTSDMIDELTRSATWESQARSSARLYRAAFLRDPDTRGMQYWINQRRVGRSLTWQANYFANSEEFRNRYGSLTNGQFVERVYQNVLGRAPDSNGFSFWVNRLNTGTTRGRMLAEFSETGEHRRLTDARVDGISMTFAMLRRVPTTTELSWMVGQARRVIAWWLLHTYPYADRFS